MLNVEDGVHAASFRDPNGHVVRRGNDLFRVVHPRAQQALAAYMASGLHEELISAGLLVDHEDLGLRVDWAPPGWQVLRVGHILDVSYASEWSFSQLRDAALLTLNIQSRALRKGWSLKDATSFNVMFRGSQPVFIDTLSFELSDGAEAWVAYRQFCEHFLAPLALLKFRGASVAALWSSQIEGVPLALASSLLPLRTWVQFGLLTHIHLHARAGRGAVGDAAAKAQVVRRVSGFLARLTESLSAAVEALSPPVSLSSWTEYRHSNTYTDPDARLKQEFVLGAAKQIGTQRALDLGSNDGFYSKLLIEQGIDVIAVESDAACCEKIYLRSRCETGLSGLLTLHVDLTNPSSSHGWGHVERSSWVQRVGRVDLVLALALIHHISISRQVPYERIAAFFATLGEYLIIEYVPPDDPMSRQLLAARTGLHEYVDALYGLEAFESAFATYFSTRQRSVRVAGGRLLYLMQRLPCGS
jgi:hypothetical protein